MPESCQHLRRELEERWRSRLMDARERYQLAKTEAARSKQIWVSLDNPDGSFAFQQALRAESGALREYIRVLRIFTDLILGNKIPED